MERTIGQTFATVPWLRWLRETVAVGTRPMALLSVVRKIDSLASACRSIANTKMITASLRPVWVMTGNNVRLKGDLGRRVVPIDLDAKCEHPEDRKFDRPDLIDWAQANRPRLVVAVGHGRHHLRAVARTSMSRRSIAGRRQRAARGVGDIGRRPSPRRRCVTGRSCADGRVNRSPAPARAT